MKYLFILLSALILSSCSASQFAMNTLIVADWGQTRDIATNPKYKEDNKLLTHSPSIGDMNEYFILSLVSANIGYYLMPTEYRKTFAIVVSVNQSYYIIANYSIGIRIKL